MALGHSLAVVSLTTEVTHKAAANLAIAEGRDVIRTKITFRRGLYASLNLLEVLNVHILREAFNTRRREITLIEAFWTIDGRCLGGRLDTVDFKAF